MYEALVKSSCIADTVGGTFYVHADDVHSVNAVSLVTQHCEYKYISLVYIVAIKLKMKKYIMNVNFLHLFFLLLSLNFYVLTVQDGSIKYAVVL